jgi:hypothetical protein
MAVPLLVCTKAPWKNRDLWYLFYEEKVWRCWNNRHTFMCSVWGQISFLENCIQLDRYVQEKPEKYDWCSGCPWISTSDDNLEEATAMPLVDRRVSIIWMAQKFSIAFEKVCARCVPKQLTEEHKHSCTDTSSITKISITAKPIDQI